ncbi:MAG: hypothetical protein AAF366_15805 [Pseudomonadota bacterium]
MNAVKRPSPRVSVHPMKEDRVLIDMERAQLDQMIRDMEQVTWMLSQVHLGLKPLGSGGALTSWTTEPSQDDLSAAAIATMLAMAVERTARTEGDRLDWLHLRMGNDLSKIDSECGEAIQ